VISRMFGCWLLGRDRTISVIVSPSDRSPNAGDTGRRRSSLRACVRLDAR